MGLRVQGVGLGCEVLGTCAYDYERGLGYVHSAATGLHNWGLRVVGSEF